MKILWDWALESMMACRYFSSSLLRLPLTPTIGWLQRVIVAWLSGWIHDSTFRNKWKRNEGQWGFIKWVFYLQWLVLGAFATLPGSKRLDFIKSWSNEPNVLHLFILHLFILVTMPKSKQTGGDWTGLSLTVFSQLCESQKHLHSLPSLGYVSPYVSACQS